MMRSGALYILLATLAPAVIAAAAPKPMSNAGRKLIQSCDAHKFETLVDMVVDGQPHQSKVKLCGKSGQSDAQWIATLKDAAAKLKANDEMAAAAREQIITAINGEIARIELAQTPARMPAPVTEQESAASLPPPRPRPQAQSPVSEEYAALPPLPAAPPPPPHLLGPGGMAAALGMTGSKVSSLPLAEGPPPKLSFACYSPGDVGDDAPCAEFQRETMVTVSAGENIARGVILRFERNGEQRADVDLPALTRGKSMRVSLPREVCSGFTDGKLDLQLVRNGELLKTDGPYPLRC